MRGRCPPSPRGKGHVPSSCTLYRLTPPLPLHLPYTSSHTSLSLLSLFPTPVSTPITAVGECLASSKMPQLRRTQERRGEGREEKALSRPCPLPIPTAPPLSSYVRLCCDVVAVNSNKGGSGGGRAGMESKGVVSRLFSFTPHLFWFCVLLLLLLCVCFFLNIHHSVCLCCLSFFLVWKGGEGRGRREVAYHSILRFPPLTHFLPWHTGSGCLKKRGFFTQSRTSSAQIRS